LPSLSDPPIIGTIGLKLDRARVRPCGGDLRSASRRVRVGCGQNQKGAELILEQALLAITPGSEAQFEAALEQAEDVISQAAGFRSLKLLRGIERPSTISSSTSGTRSTTIWSASASRSCSYAGAS
jgi:hypothetical protein